MSPDGEFESKGRIVKVLKAAAAVTTSSGSCYIFPILNTKGRNYKNDSSIVSKFAVIEVIV